MKQNYDVVDLTKFIFAILICALHSLCEAGGMLWLAPLTRIAVPCFFTFSGFFFFRKWNQNPSVKEVYLPFLKRNCLLYLSWFVLLIPIMIYIGTFRRGFLHFCANVVFGSTFPASWYIMALIIGMTIVLFASKYLNNKIILCLSVLVYAICVMLTNYGGLLSDNGIIYKLFWEIYPGLIQRSFPVSLMGICFGKILAEEPKSDTDIHKTKKLALLTFLLLVLLYSEDAIVVHIGCRIESDCFFMLIPLAYFIPKLILSFNNNIKYAKELRQLSVIIYCMHLSLIRLIRGIYEPTNPLPFSIVLFIGAIVVSICFGLVIIWLSKKPKFKFIKVMY